MKSLVVEDDFISRFVLQKMLAPYGVSDVAVNGREAVQAFTIAVSEKQPYDLICMDIMMPEMDGIESLKVIQEKIKEFDISPKEEPKIIMVTALDTPKEVVEAYYHGGCTYYLTKPINKSKILFLLEEMELV
jgi:two-component system, chemotaxis family, chemotaxis protein CheY